MTMPRFTAVVMTMLAVYWYAPALIAQEIDSPAARARDIRITDRMIGYDPADTDTTSIRNDTLAEIIATVFANKPAGLAQFTRVEDQAGRDRGRGQRRPDGRRDNLPH